jgi:hypothetical protein
MAVVVMMLPLLGKSDGRWSAFVKDKLDGEKQATDAVIRDPPVMAPVLS